MFLSDFLSSETQHQQYTEYKFWQNKCFYMFFLNHILSFHLNHISMTCKITKGSIVFNESMTCTRHFIQLFKFSLLSVEIILRASDSSTGFLFPSFTFTACLCCNEFSCFVILTVQFVRCKAYNKQTGPCCTRRYLFAIGANHALFGVN